MKNIKKALDRVFTSGVVHQPRAVSRYSETVKKNLNLVEAVLWMEENQ